MSRLDRPAPPPSWTVGGRRWRARALAALLGAALSGGAVARAEVVDATSTTLVSGRQDPRDGVVHTIVPVYELVSLRATDFHVPGIADMNVVLSGWGAVALADPIENKHVLGDLDLAFAEGTPLRRRLGAGRGPGHAALRGQLRRRSAGGARFRETIVRRGGGRVDPPALGPRRDRAPRPGAGRPPGAVARAAAGADRLRPLPPARAPPRRGAGGGDLAARSAAADHRRLPQDRARSVPAAQLDLRGVLAGAPRRGGRLPVPAAARAPAFPRGLPRDHRRRRHRARRQRQADRDLRSGRARQRRGRVAAAGA